MSTKRPTAAEGWIRNAGFAVADDALDPALRRQMAAALRLEIHNQRVAADKTVEFRKGRRKGAISDKAKYIHSLATNSPKHTARWLFDHDDKSVIGKMAFSTFERHVGAARKKNSPSV